MSAISSRLSSISQWWSSGTPTPSIEPSSKPPSTSTTTTTAVSRNLTDEFETESKSDKRKEVKKTFGKAKKQRSERVRKRTVETRLSRQELIEKNRRENRSKQENSENSDELKHDQPKPTETMSESLQIDVSEPNHDGSVPQQQQQQQHVKVGKTEANVPSPTTDESIADPFQVPSKESTKNRLLGLSKAKLVECAMFFYAQEDDEKTSVVNQRFVEYLSRIPKRKTPRIIRRVPSTLRVAGEFSKSPRREIVITSPIVQRQILAHIDKWDQRDRELAAMTDEELMSYVEKEVSRSNHS